MAAPLYVQPVLPGMRWFFNRAEVAAPIASRQDQGLHRLTSPDRAWWLFAMHDALPCHVASAVVLFHDLALQ